jgi:hypothetical protein
MRYINLLVITLTIVTLAACNNTEIGSGKEVTTDAIYFDYKIWGEEGAEDVTCKIQYYFGGPDGETLLLEEPSTVQLDNEVLTADSTRLTGAFYELQKPLQEFGGNHTITFTDLHGKQFKEPFRFTPFTLENDFSEGVRRDDLNLQLDGLQPGDLVRVVLVDTAFATEDISEIDTVQNGGLKITKSQLQTLNNGPVTLQLFKEEDRRVKNATKEGGRIVITYGLTREFELKD